MNADNNYTHQQGFNLPLNQSTPVHQLSFGQAGYSGHVYGSPVMQNVDMNSRLDAICMKLDGMCDQLKKLDLMEARLSNLETSAKTIKSDVENLKSTMSEMDKSMTFINQQFEKNKSDLSELQKTVSHITSEAKETELFIADEISELREELGSLKERHVDLQARSMRDNLVFSGIEELPPQQDGNGRPIGEDTERTLSEFLATKMDIHDVGFHRVHRMGRLIPGKTRPIVAKFVMYKDRERVRKSAKEKLTGSNYGISEQFPREINDRRKALYPTYKNAKRQGKRANFVMDKLYVDGVLIQPVSVQESQPGQSDRNDAMEVGHRDNGITQATTTRGGQSGAYSGGRGRGSRGRGGRGSRPFGRGARSSRSR
ncbi:hypothetical protein FSP39_005899 [Pinctada imbricata]|uniref:Uncharacterized protein n=1 Tax=Pinctada imbricata TaxID=66713 RepID=A0AA88YPY8_PINIB|nr:hypothetical protein FSP39_005899 [Pinctada imbricata]